MLADMKKLADSQSLAPVNAVAGVTAPNLHCGSQLGQAFPFHAPKEFEKLMGKTINPPLAPRFYGSPPMPQLAISNRTPLHLPVHDAWVRLSYGWEVFINTTQSVHARDFYSDSTSCAMDALNLAVGRVRVSRYMPRVCLCTFVS